MAEVISGDKLNRHNVDKYNFKILAVGGSGAKKHHFEQPLHATQTQEAPPLQHQQTNQQKQKSDSSKDSIIESLLKKTDEISSNFIKLQMKLESMQEEHKKELEHIKQVTLEEGIQKGKELAQKECNEKYEQTLNLFGQSIQKLEEEAKLYNISLDNVKKELTSAAIDIAKEVVQVELNENSSNIAASLAESLLEDLKEASKITLKVNPKDFTYLSSHFQNINNIKIVSDAAVNEGGVIAISDIENIDAQIPKRFERVKRVILSE
jgi:flagellar assembly protein FliH